MARNASERIPRVIRERKVRHSLTRIGRHSLRLHVVTPKLWRLTVMTTPSLSEQWSRNFRDIEEAHEAFRAFPDPFMHGGNTNPDDGWYRDLEAEERATQ